MADLDKLVLNGTEYNFVDSNLAIALDEASEQLAIALDEASEQLNERLEANENVNASVYPYTDQLPITLNGITVTNTAGDIFHIEGTSSADRTNINLIDGHRVQKYRSTFKAGTDIFVHYKVDRNLTIQIWYNTEISGSGWAYLTEFSESGDYTYSLPSNCKILLARICVFQGSYNDDFEFFISDKSPNFSELERNYVAARRHSVGVPANSDLNDYKSSGIYVISSGIISTCLNLPPERYSSAGWLICFGNESTVLQMYVDFFSEKVLAVRSYNASNWYEWETIGSSKDFRCPIAALESCDLNTVTKSGCYLLADSNEYTNKPLGVGNIGFLIVYELAGGWVLQLFVQFDGAIIYKRRNNPHAVTWEEWGTISGGGNVYNVTNNYSFPEYSETVTLNASPSITADTNNYLAPIGTTADRTSDILAMLSSNGICRLGPGDYYVSNLQMPDGSSIIGSGHATRIRLAGTSDGYAIKMGSRCLVQDLRIVGSDTDITIGDTIGGRHGILWQGDYTQHQTAPDRSMVNNVWIYNFSGGGITCYDTGYGTNNGLEVNNAYIYLCWAGVNISYWSEFHKFTNVRAGNCRIGCVNNGGNNIFVNCDFSGNQEIAMLMDNSQGQSPNNTHGSCIGCVFNHTAHAGTSNAGVGIKILNCASGFVFSGCQIFFSQIYLEDSEGIAVTDCNFGLSNCDVTIVNGGAVLFANNVVQGQIPISVTNNQKVHFANNYVRSSGAIWQLT